MGFERETNIKFCAAPGCDNEVTGRERLCTEHKAKAKVRPRTRSNAKTLTLDQLEEKVFESISGVGLMVLPFNQFDGVCVLIGAEKQARTLRDLAEVSPAAKRAMETAVQASAMANVVAAFAPTLIPILMNHKLIPGNANAALMMASRMAQTDESTGGDNANVRSMISQIMANMNRVTEPAARPAGPAAETTEETIADDPASEFDKLAS